MLLKGRKHPRSRQQFHVQLCSVNGSRGSEFATVENVSINGARLATARFWEPGLLVDLKSPTRKLLGRARVVYCQSTSAKAFAVGLNLLTWTFDWEEQTHSFASKETKPVHDWHNLAHEEIEQRGPTKTD